LDPDQGLVFINPALHSSRSAATFAQQISYFMLCLTLRVLQVLYHRDIWTHSNEWLRPLQRCWGTLEKAAASTAAGTAAVGGKH
jgi:hypothetical protein